MTAEDVVRQVLEAQPDAVDEERYAMLAGAIVRALRSAGLLANDPLGENVLRPDELNAHNDI